MLNDLYFWFALIVGLIVDSAGSRLGPAATQAATTSPPLSCHPPIVGIGNRRACEPSLQSWQVLGHVGPSGAPYHAGSVRRMIG